MTVNRLLQLGAGAFLVFLVLLEGFCVLTGQPTISDRLQEWAAANVQLLALVSFLVGWLVAHFTSPVEQRLWR
jgi:hypothetical protein